MLTPFDVQYEIYKLLPHGYSVDWDRWFPRPYTMAYSIGRRLEDGRILKGEIVFNGFELKEPHAKNLIQARFRYLLRQFKELDPAFTQSTPPTAPPRSNPCHLKASMK